MSPVNQLQIIPTAKTFRRIDSYTVEQRLCLRHQPLLVEADIFIGFPVNEFNGLRSAFGASSRGGNALCEIYHRSLRDTSLKIKREPIVQIVTCRKPRRGPSYDWRKVIDQTELGKCTPREATSKMKRRSIAPISESGSSQSFLVRAPRTWAPCVFLPKLTRRAIGSLRNFRGVFKGER